MDGREKRWIEEVSRTYILYICIVAGALSRERDMTVFRVRLTNQECCSAKPRMGNGVNDP